MTRILSKPLDLMHESYAWCFKDAEKIGFQKSAKNSQSPPTPSMWWRGFKQLYISLWCLTTTREEVLQCYSDVKTVETKCMHIFFYASRIGVARVYGAYNLRDKSHDIKKARFFFWKRDMSIFSWHIFLAFLPKIN